VVVVVVVDIDGDGDVEVDATFDGNGRNGTFQRLDVPRQGWRGRDADENDLRVNGSVDLHVAVSRSRTSFRINSIG